MKYHRISIARHGKGKVSWIEGRGRRRRWEARGCLDGGAQTPGWGNQPPAAAFVSSEMNPRQTEDSKRTEAMESPNRRLPTTAGYACGMRMDATACPPGPRAFSASTAKPRSASLRGVRAMSLMAWARNGPASNTPAKPPNSETQTRGETLSASGYFYWCAFHRRSGNEYAGVRPWNFV